MSYVTCGFCMLPVLPETCMCKKCGRSTVELFMLKKLLQEEELVQHLPARPFMALPYVDERSYCGYCFAPLINVHSLFAKCEKCYRMAIELQQTGMLREAPRRLPHTQLQAALYGFTVIGEKVESGLRAWLRFAVLHRYGRPRRLDRWAQGLRSARSTNKGAVTWTISR